MSLPARARAAASISLIAITSAAALIACDKAPNLRGRIAGLHQLADDAEKNGAVKCAPRELALTRAYTEFAEMELEKGSPGRAESFVEKAELNAAATSLQSPVEHCGNGPAPVALPGDRDGDGYLDPVDTCPEEPEIFQGFEDQDGCADDPDTDGDKVRDSIDPCPLVAEDLDAYLDEDGCPEADNDLDTILDAIDKCPTDPEDPDGFEDADGCPDADNDGDSVLDVTDQCPNTPGQTTADPLGCPIKPALVVLTDCEVRITQQIHFEYNKAIVKKESYPILDAVNEVLEKNPAINLQVQGHTDSRGSDSYNLKLSDQRAASVRMYLVSRGMPPARLESKGYGETLPIVGNDTDENRALNRRVQFIRTEGQKEGCGPQPAK